MRPRTLVLSLVLGLVLLAGSNVVQVSGAGVVVGIYPPSASDSAGLVTIAVNVFDVVDLQAVEFSVRYDTAILDGVSVSFDRTIPGNCGCGLFFNQTFYETQGVVTVAYTLLGSQSSFSGTGALAFLTFRFTTPGTSALLLEDVTLVDRNFIAIPHTLSNGRVFTGAVGGGGGGRLILY